MANSEYNYIPMYIRRTINNRPKDVVTAKYWNELFNLLITQGDHTAEAVANVRGVFRINVTYSNGVYTADKTFDEIKAAYDAGQLPYVVLTSGTLDFIYTLAYFSVPDGTGQDFVDFARYRIDEDTLETEMLRVYSYTMDSGSNVVKRIDEFKMPTSLKNPNALTFTGGATGSYDGSEPETVHIPVIPYEVINKNTAARHSHDNKTVLDGITAEKVTEWDGKNSITDSGGYFTSDTVEGALQEVGAGLAHKQDKLVAGDNITIGADGKTISATGGGSTVELDTALTESGKAADAKAVGDALTGKQDTISDLEAIRSGAAKGATAQSKSITDSGGHFTTDTVEGALQEIGAELAGINTLLGSGIQISFTLGGTTCTANAGETWIEWVGSGYKTIANGMILSVHPYDAEGVIFLDEAGVYALSLDGNTPVRGGDRIISGATYDSVNWGG